MLTDVFYMGVIAAVVGLTLLLSTLLAIRNGSVLGAPEQRTILILGAVCFITAILLLTRHGFYLESEYKKGHIVKVDQVVNIN